MEHQKDIATHVVVIIVQVQVHVSYAIDANYLHWHHSSLGPFDLWSIILNVPKGFSSDVSGRRKFKWCWQTWYVKHAWAGSDELSSIHMAECPAKCGKCWNRLPTKQLSTLPKFNSETLNCFQFGDRRLSDVQTTILGGFDHADPETTMAFKQQDRGFYIQDTTCHTGEKVLSCTSQCQHHHCFEAEKWLPSRTHRRSDRFYNNNGETSILYPLMLTQVFNHVPSASTLNLDLPNILIPSIAFISNGRLSSCNASTLFNSSATA